MLGLLLGCGRLLRVFFDNLFDLLFLPLALFHLHFIPLNIALDTTSLLALIKPGLHPDPIHLQPGLPILQQFTVHIKPQQLKPNFPTHSFNLFPLKIVNTDTVILGVKIILQFTVALA